MNLKKNYFLLSDIFGMYEDDPYQDLGSEHLPSRSPSPTALDIIDILEDKHSQNDQEQRKPRKRVRQPRKWKKNITQGKTRER